MTKSRTQLDWIRLFVVHTRDQGVPLRFSLDERGLPSRSYRARARARRACCAACSALRLSRRARASWWPRRNDCASPRRADICARARFSFMRFISVLLVLRVWLIGWLWSFSERDAVRRTAG